MDAAQTYGDDPEPPVASTKIRLERYIEVELVGSDNAELRKLTRATIEVAQAVKHWRSTISRTESGIAADAVICSRVCCGGFSRRTE
ncbi:hypothetical protein ABI214_07965 [Prescottella soli]|uniref:Uncharacterized protein n=1 Tax=Prescottella soli TaxID=1543852 RepID=A0ABW9FNQ9_9NOCA